MIHVEPFQGRVFYILCTLMTLGELCDRDRAGRRNKTGKSVQKNRAHVPEVSFMTKYCPLFLVCASLVNTDVL